MGNCMEMSGKKSKKVGVMGGTFNPVHIGHLMLAEWTMEAAGLDEVLFIPAGCPYMKSQEEILDGVKRLHMVELAIRSRDDFLCSDMEIRRNGYTYTYETLEQLKMENPDTEYYFIMGADCLFSLENWVHPERILRACTLIAAARNGSPMSQLECKRRELEQRYHCSIRLLPFLSMEISSSDIRSRLKTGRSIRYLVPDPVFNYIAENKLYQEVNVRR